MGRILSIVFAVLFCFEIDGQIIPDYETEGSDLNVLYRNERTFEFFAHSRGYGMLYRRAKHVTGKRKSFIEIKGASLRHPKEIKLTGTDVERKRYIYGKLHNVFMTDVSVGFQNVLAGKADKKSVEIRYNYSIGPGIALAKPYYYTIVTNDNSSFNKYKKFNEESFTQDSVIGRAPFTYGLAELRAYPYVAGKFNLSFEYAPYGNLVKALETGVSVHYFPVPLPMMARNNKEFLIVTIHIGFVFGKRWY
ncbi:MAG: hypothetical protein AB7O73_11555 [Bacteroidia bacterium]